MARFTVNCRVLDNEAYDAEDHVRAYRYLDQICGKLSDGWYVIGHRNNLAVDLACMCHVLALDPVEVAKAAWEQAMPYARDETDLEDRIKTIKMYLYSWDTFGRNGVFGYLMDWYDEEVEPSGDLIELVNVN